MINHQFEQELIHHPSFGVTFLGVWLNTFNTTRSTCSIFLIFVWTSQRHSHSQREESSTNRHLKELNSSQREVPTSKSQRWFLRRIGLVEDMWSYLNQRLTRLTTTSLEGVQLKDWWTYDLQTHIFVSELMTVLALPRPARKPWYWTLARGTLGSSNCLSARCHPIWSYRYDYVIYCNIIIMLCIYTHAWENMHTYVSSRASYAIALESLFGAKVVLVQGPPGVKCCDGGVPLEI